MGTRWQRSLFLAASLALTGCGGQEAYAPEPGTSAETMFRQACAHCHGDRGGGKFGFLLELRGSRLVPAEIEALIARGEGLMPSFPHLSIDQRRRLAAYTRGL